MAIPSKVIATAKSKSGAQIRLTEKEWKHIITTRPQLEEFQEEVLRSVENPDEVYTPPSIVKPQLHAVKRFERLGDVGLGENLVVVYRELTPRERFIITVFPMSDKRKKRSYRSWREL